MSTENPLRYHVLLGGQIHEAREVQGEERVSAPFRIEARFQVPSVAGFFPSPDLDPEALIRTEVSVLLIRDGDATGARSADVVRKIDGIVTSIEELLPRAFGPRNFAE